MKIKTKRGARRIRNQRVITRRFVTTDYTGCSYITAGKRYEVTFYGSRTELITCDHGDRINIVSPKWSFKCTHIKRCWSWLTI